jgi:hypothetical protein
MRTYTLYIGKIREVTKHYKELGFPALKKGGYDKHLVGYFLADTGKTEGGFRRGLPEVSVISRKGAVLRKRKEPKAAEGTEGEEECRGGAHTRHAGDGDGEARAV